MAELPEGRALRAELEAVQARIKEVKAALALPHAPEFLEKREALQAALVPLQKSVRRLEGEARLADAERARLERRLETLKRAIDAEAAHRGVPLVSVAIFVLGAVGVVWGILWLKELNLLGHPAVLAALVGVPAFAFGLIWRWRLAGQASPYAKAASPVVDPLAQPQHQPATPERRQPLSPRNGR